MKKTVTKGLKHAATTLTSYALYSLFTCTWHYARSIHWFPPSCFWIISQMVYQFNGCLSGVCVTQSQNFFSFFVVLHNSVHYASDATLNGRNEILSCARPSLLQNWTQLCMPTVSKSSFLSCVTQIEPLSPFSLLTTQPCSFM